MDENGDPSKSLAIVSLLRVLENERRNEKCPAPPKRKPDYMLWSIGESNS
jgi:hypothetical protein